MGRQRDDIIVCILCKITQQHIVCENLREVSVCIEGTDIGQHPVTTLTHTVGGRHLHVHGCVRVINRYDRVLDISLRIFGCCLKRIQRTEGDGVIVGLAVEIRYRLIIGLHRCQLGIVRRVAVDDVGCVVGGTDHVQLVGLCRHGHMYAIQRVLAFKIEDRIVGEGQQTSRGLTGDILFSRYIRDTRSIRYRFLPCGIINRLVTRLSRHGDDVCRIVLGDRDVLVSGTFDHFQVTTLQGKRTARVGGFRTGHGQRIVGVREVLRVVTDGSRTHTVYFVRPGHYRHLIRDGMVEIQRRHTPTLGIDGRSKGFVRQRSRVTVHVQTVQDRAVRETQVIHVHLGSTAGNTEIGVIIAQQSGRCRTNQDVQGHRNIIRSIGDRV